MKKDMITRMSDRILDGQIKAQELKAEDKKHDEEYLNKLKEESEKRKD